ncbi:MAG: hypothetical protein HZA50_06490 [Planctomycetes bacterium]|nr:hypothetical protein [Planctomycetota bacterium]
MHNGKLIAFVTMAFCLLSAAALVASGESAPPPATTKAATPAAQPASGPATSPATEPAEPLLTFEAIKQLNAVLEKASPTAAERVMCSAITDRNPQIDDAIFYAMLARADKMPAVEAKYFACLNRLSTPAVLLEPEKYRMAPTRLSILVFAVQRLTRGRGQLSKSWAGPNRSEEPVWLILALNAECVYPYEEPLRIYSTKDPRPLLGVGAEENYDKINDVYQYKTPGIRLEMAGLFYKLSREEDKANRSVRDYPVFIAWQFVDPSEIGRTKVDTSPGTWGVLLFFLVVGLGIAFFVFMKSVKRGKDAEPMILLMKKKREQEARERMMTGEHQPVDPDLQSALEEFEKNKNAGDEKDSSKPG